MNKKSKVKVKTTTTTINMAIFSIAILAISSTSTMAMAHRDHHDGNGFSNSGQDSGRENSGSSSLGCKILAFGAGTLLSGGNFGVGAAATSIC